MPTDYTKGKTYKLISDETEFVYVGSTTQPLAKRLWDHKDKAKRGERNSKVYQIMREVGIDTFRIILINEFPCENKEQLCAEEERCRKEIDQEKLLNTHRCYANIPFGLPVKEYGKEYSATFRVNNPEKVKEYSKKYRAENREHIKEHKKTYWIENREKIKEQRKEYRAGKFVCDCGSIFSMNGQSRHFRSKKHMEYMTK